MQVIYTFADTPAGNVLLTSDGTFLTGLHWKVFKRAPRAMSDWREDASFFRDTLRQLDEYFAGNRQTFDIPHQAQGTEFQKSVWRELATIPYGAISSYQKVADAISRPKAVRAVGTAIGSNPLSIFVPCHRVLTSNGQLGGYAGGLPSKALLLQREGIQMPSMAPYLS